MDQRFCPTCLRESSPCHTAQQLWSFDKNSIWKTHLHHQLRPMTPSCISAPTNKRQVCIPPQPITLHGFAFKDLQLWISLLSSQASTLLLPIATICLPSSFQLPYFLGPPLHHQYWIPGGKTSLILILNHSFKLMSFIAFMSSSGVRAPKK
ncbi:hypothetical protein AMECASPLE_013590 [Ameca splendens]|uniref:Uncharacterized protein n=1 Tax=Ameca splendens TaxID=208324 RepID=A0ABV0ZC58_9TELE